MHQMLRVASDAAFHIIEYEEECLGKDSVLKTVDFAKIETLSMGLQLYY